MRKWRKMTWAIFVWTGLIVAWMIGGASAVSNEADKCATDPSVTSGILSKQDCIDATTAGGGIGIALIGFIGFVGFVALAIVWFMTKPKEKIIVVVQSNEEVDAV